MAMGLPAMMGISFGSNLLSGMLRARARQREKQQALAALSPLDKMLSQWRIGPTSTEGSLLNSLVNQRLSQLAQRGVLQSSIAAPEVAAAIAPVEAQRQQRIDDMAFRLAAAKSAIYGEATPGVGDAFAGALGDVGQVAAMMAGQKLYQQQMAAPPTNFMDSSGQLTQPNYDPFAQRDYSGYSTEPAQTAMTSYVNQNRPRARKIYGG